MVIITTSFNGPPVTGSYQPQRAPSNNGADGSPSQEIPPPSGPIDTYVPGAPESPTVANVVSDFYAEVLDNPEQYPHLSRALTDAVTGEQLVLPFEITPDMEQHVANLRAKFPAETQTQRGTALLLLRSLIPSDRFLEIITTEINTSTMEFIPGLPAEAGGQEVRFNDDRTLPIRIQNGTILPQQILDTPAGERVGFCLEQSQLLICLLRAAGIEAHIHEEPSHAYVIATLDGETYRLDPAQRIFVRNAHHPSTDREAMATYYRSSAFTFRYQGRIEESLQCIDTSLLLNPEDIRSWNTRANILRSMGRLKEAYASTERALEINPLHMPALANQAYILGDLGRIEEARAAWQIVIEIAPNRAAAEAAAQEALARLTAEPEPNNR